VSAAVSSTTTLYERRPWALCDNAQLSPSWTWEGESAETEVATAALRATVLASCARAKLKPSSTLRERKASGSLPAWPWPIAANSADARRRLRPRALAKGPLLVLLRGLYDNTQRLLRGKWTQKRSAIRTKAKSSETSGGQGWGFLSEALGLERGPVWILQRARYCSACDRVMCMRARFAVAEPTSGNSLRSSTASGRCAQFQGSSASGPSFPAGEVCRRCPWHAA
jgi:hypothetical protein